MARSSPRFKQEDDAESTHRIISVDVDQELTCVLVARVAGRWFYIDVRPSGLKDKKLREQFCDAAQLVVDELNAGDDAPTSVDHTKPRSTASSKVSPGSQKTGDARPSLSPAQTDLASLFWPALEPRFDAAAKANTKSTKGEKPRPTLMQWYKAPIACLSVGCRSGDEQFSVSERSDLDGDAYVRNAITPHMPLPKPLRSMPGVPWYSPSELEVCAESHDIHMPLHPTIVQLHSADSAPDKAPVTNGNHKDGAKADAPRYFLKLATRDDASSVERELRILANLQKRDMYMDDDDAAEDAPAAKRRRTSGTAKGRPTNGSAGQDRHGKVRAPRLAGLVALPSSPTSHSSILGFLLTLIPQPSRPLLSYMDSDVSRSRRDAWATEVTRTVRALHAAGIVWGDAKGDNFLVDKHDRLWIIDFGGSYTPGWVDEKKAGTKEGDKQGVEKVVNGVKDPDEFLDRQEEEQAANEERANGNGKETNGMGNKRSRKDETGSVKRKRRT